MTPAISFNTHCPFTGYAYNTPAAAENWAQLKTMITAATALSSFKANDMDRTFPHVVYCRGWQDMANDN